MFLYTLLNGLVREDWHVLLWQLKKRKANRIFGETSTGLSAQISFPELHSPLSSCLLDIPSLVAEQTFQN